MFWDEYSRFFRDFTSRESQLRAVTRWSLYDTMLYRTDLWTHSKRVGRMVSRITPYAKKCFGSFDGTKAVLMGLVHDDAEVIFGDVQAGNKSKMTAEQLREVEQREKDAIEELVSKSPRYIGPYLYEDLLCSVVNINSPEALVVKYCDKMDAFGEALHELYGGNLLFARNVINEYGVIPLPADYYIDWICRFQKEHDRIADALRAHIDIFQQPEEIDSQAIAAKGVQHSRDSLRLKTGNIHYDAWKEIILSDPDAEDHSNLLEQKESLAKAN